MDTQDYLDQQDDEMSAVYDNEGWKDGFMLSPAQEDVIEAEQYVDAISETLERLLEMDDDQREQLEAMTGESYGIEVVATVRALAKAEDRLKEARKRLDTKEDRE